MRWNKIDLSIVNIYGKLELSYTPIFLEMVEKFKNEDCKEILDLGSGYGKHSLYLAENNFNVTSVDIDSNVIKCLEEYINNNQIDNINLFRTDICGLPFKNKTFDAVICTSVIHHQKIKEIKKSISEINRVLKPDGLFLVDFLSEEDDSFGLGIEIEKNTYMGSRPGEENVSHYYTKEEQIMELFNNFQNIQVLHNEYTFTLENRVYKSKMLDVKGYK